MRLYTVQADMVTDLWSVVAPMLEKAMSRHPFMDTNGLLQLLLTGFAALIVMTDEGGITGAVVMSRDRYPPERFVANIVAVAGKGLLKHTDAVAAHLEAWARAHGCDTIGGVGRPGWTKFVQRLAGHQQPLVQAWKALEA